MNFAIYTKCLPLLLCYSSGFVCFSFASTFESIYFAIISMHVVIMSNMYVCLYTSSIYEFIIIDLSRIYYSLKMKPDVWHAYPKIATKYFLEVKHNENVQLRKCNLASIVHSLGVAVFSLITNCENFYRLFLSPFYPCITNMYLIKKPNKIYRFHFTVLLRKRQFFGGVRNF